MTQLSRSAMRSPFVKMSCVPRVLNMTFETVHRLLSNICVIYISGIYEGLDYVSYTRILTV